MKVKSPDSSDDSEDEEMSDELEPEPTAEDLNAYHAKNPRRTDTTWGGLAQYFSSWWWHGQKPEAEPGFDDRT